MYFFFLSFFMGVFERNNQKLLTKSKGNENFKLITAVGGTKALVNGEKQETVEGVQSHSK